MPQNFSLYVLYNLGRPQLDDEPFDLTCLPFDIADGVRIEDVSGFLRADAFDCVTPYMGTLAVKELRRTRYALVHRYERQPIIANGEVGEQQRNEASEILVKNIAACLRLIRPMREFASVMYGKVREDGTFDGWVQLSC
jgi:hypothetical protein